MADTKRVLVTPHNPLYTVFINFKVAFDSALKHRAMPTLANLSVALNDLYRLLENRISIGHGVIKLPLFTT